MKKHHSLISKLMLAASTLYSGAVMAGPDLGAAEQQETTGRG